jgi:hemerythrin
MYTWDKSLETGYEQIDNQHKQLFAVINEFLANCKEGSTASTTVLTRNLNYLNDYTIQHFFDEEIIQRDTKYPDFENHKKVHDDFKATIRDFKIRLLIKGPSRELTDEVKQTIGDWLVNHIKVMDKKLGTYLKENAGNFACVSKGSPTDGNA